MRIAKTLNDAKVPNPTGQHRKGSKKVAKFWAATGVREVLRRELYRGQIVYGKTRWQDKGGTKVKADVPEAEWLVLSAPELRIVPEELWQAAHDRLRRSHRAYLRRNNGQLGGKPESGLESKYLLSGFLGCGACDGTMMVTKRTSQRGRPQLVYVFATHRTRGDAACPIKQALPATRIHEAVVWAFTRDILTRERLEYVIEQLLAAADQGDQLASRRESLTADLTRIEGELKRLGDAVAAGAAVQTLLDAIKAREQERADVKAKLEHLDGLAKASQSWDRDVYGGLLPAALKDWHALMEYCPQGGRQALRQLLTGPIVAGFGPS